MRTIFVAFGAVAIAGLAVGAQAPQQEPAAPRPSTQAMSPAGHTMTVTGCLKPWGGMSMGPATGSPGSPGSTTTPPAGTTAAGQMDSGRYMLTNVEHDTGSTMPGRPGVTTGAPAGTPTPGSGSTVSSPSHAAMHGSLVLEAVGSTLNLAAHVNHKIQVTGTMKPPMGGKPDHSAHGAGTPGSAPTEPTAARGTGGPAMAPPGSGIMDHMSTSVLSVTSVQMLSANCP